MLRKPEILSVEYKQTKFERSKGDLRRVSELCKFSLRWAQFSNANTWICVVFKLVDESYRYTRGFEAIDDLIGVWIIRWYPFLARLTPVFWEFFRTNWWILICKLRSKRRLSSDHACMKNVSAEVSIFCLWTKWRHLVICSKIEFRELYYSSRCALDKICEIYTFDSCPHEWSSQKSFLACGDAKKENWRICLWDMCPKCCYYASLTVVI